MSILRIAGVKAETGHRSHSSIYCAINSGLFTKPVPIGERAVGWPSDEVRVIIAAQVAGFSKDQLRALVNQLHAKRVEAAPMLRAA